MCELRESYAWSNTNERSVNTLPTCHPHQATVFINTQPVCQSRQSREDSIEVGLNKIL